MAGMATTPLSSKGQVVIPEEIRDRLGLKSGAITASMSKLGSRIRSILSSVYRA